MYLLVLEPMSVEPVFSLYESACQNYLFFLLQTNYVPAWAGLEPVYSVKAVHHSVKTRLYNTPSPILHCISQLIENKGGRGH